MNVSILNFILFALFGLAVLFGGHFLIYRSIVGTFNVGSRAIRIIIFFVLAFLSIGFFLASIVAHYSQSGVAKLFYVLATSWLGVALNLLLAALIIWVILWLAKLAGVTINRSIFGAFMYLLAAAFSVYGYWNAQNPQIKHLDATVNNLPASWRGKTIIQLSDVHLGHNQGVDFLQKVVEKTNAQNPDLILITGDLFDGMDGDLRVFIEPLKNLRAKEGVFFVTGNHEYYLGWEHARPILNQAGIKILDNESVNIDGLQIVGLSYNASGGTNNFSGKTANEAELIKNTRGWRAGAPSILMYHAPANLEQVAAAGINLQLSGYTHHGQLWPLQFFPWLIYGRYEYGFYAGDNFSIYTTRGAGTWGPPLRTNGRPEIPIFYLR